MKRVLSLLLSILLLFCLIGGTIPKAAAYSWASPYLDNLVSRDVMKGDNDGSLNPDRMITRAEFSALLNRAFGFSEKASKSFKDVPATAWYAHEVSIAAGQGYMQGDKSGANPNGYLTREEAATMLCRALRIEPLTGESFSLLDERSFSNWSRGFINASVDKRFVTGYPDGSFRPANRITRGEAAKMLSEVAGEIVTSANDSRVGGVVSGNLTIASSGVTLSDVTVTGDLYLTEGVGLGYVKLENVNVQGEMIISGAGESHVGESSVILTDCSISKLVVDVAKRKILTLKTDRTTSVEESLIKSSTYLEELSRNYVGFDKVTVNGPTGTFLNLTGNFGDVRLMSPGASVSLFKGEAESVTVDEAAKTCKVFLEKDTRTRALYFDTGAAVTGTGVIESVLINNDGATIAQLPEDIYIRPGVTATINGKKMGSLDAEMDALDPDFSSGYPKTGLITPNSFTQYYMTVKPGKVYYAVYLDGALRPTAEQLMVKSGPPKDAIKYGSINTLPDKELSVMISGLKPGLNYVIYSLFVDLRGKESGIERSYVETVDNVMPVLLSGYPKLSSVNRDRATISLTPNKDTSYYWAVLPDKAIAPTADQLYNQNVSGTASKGIATGGIMNTVRDIDTSNKGANLLDESVAYTFYVALRDDAGNLSKTPYKLAFTTKDLTAPSFYPEDTATETTYPKVGAVTTSAIPLEYMVNESCTLYWLAAKTGSTVLPLTTGGTPDWTSDKSRNIVKSGTGASKYGKSTASKEKTKYTLSISGLEQQMPYDIYFMLEDKNGNQSNVKMLSAKTKDTTPPTATVSSAQEIGGYFSVDRPITMTFSEIVCSSEPDGAGGYLPFSKLTDKTQLANYIRLMDTTMVPEGQKDIIWANVEVRDVDAKTILTFGADAFTLSNNNSYRFDLGYISGKVIRDTSRNEMKSKTALPFQTVPPLTYFNEVTSIDATKYDAGFLIRPDAQETGAYIYFDIMLRSDYPIEFELYAAEEIDKLDLGQVGTTHILTANYATPITEFLKTQTAYKDLKDTYYAIKIIKIDSTSVTDGVTANVNLTMNAVIGNLSKIASLRGDGKTFDTRLKEAVSRGDVSSVTAPADPFLLRVYLVDTVPPARMEAASFIAGDTQALMRIRTTKACTVYYYAIPVSEQHSVPTAYQIQTARSDAGRGIAAGSFQVPEGGTVATEHTIRGLKPPESGLNNPYKIYYCLQGKAPNPSAVYADGTFATIPVHAPKIVSSLQPTAGGGMVTVSGSWDSDCTMYYVVYPADVYEEPNRPSSEEIIKPSSPAQVIAQGSIPIEASKSFKVTIINLDYTRRYDIFAVAQKYVGTAPSGPPSVVAYLGNMAPLDNIKPAVAAGSPHSTVSYDAATNSFSGSVEVDFTEGLYYFEQDLGSANKLTEVALDAMLTYMPSNAQITLEETRTSGTEGAINYVQFSFTGLQSGSTITFSKTIGDKALNIAGTFKMTFTATKDAEGNFIGNWTAQFIPK